MGSVVGDSLTLRRQLHMRVGCPSREPRVARAGAGRLSAQFEAGGGDGWGRLRRELG